VSFIDGAIRDQPNIKEVEMKLLFKLAFILSFGWSIGLGQEAQIGYLPPGADVTYNITNATNDIAAMISDSLAQVGYVDSTSIKDNTVTPTDIIINTAFTADGHDARTLGSDAVHWSDTYISGVLKSDDALTISTEAGDITIDPVTGTAIVDGTLSPASHDTRNLGNDATHWANLFCSTLIKSDDALQIYTEADDITLSATGGDVLTSNNIVCSIHDSKTLGVDTLHWGNIYMSGLLKSDDELTISTEAGDIGFTPAGGTAQVNGSFEIGTGTVATIDTVIINDGKLGFRVGGVWYYAATQDSLDAY